MHDRNIGAQICVYVLSFRVSGLAGLPGGYQGSALRCPTVTGMGWNDAAGFASCCGPHRRSPLQGLWHWAPPPGRSPRHRQSATGLLAAIQAGLSPAGSHEPRTARSATQLHLLSCWAHELII